MCVGEETDVSSHIREKEKAPMTARGTGLSSRTRWSFAMIFKTTDVTELSAGSFTALQMWRQSSINQVGAAYMLLTKS